MNVLEKKWEAFATKNAKYYIFANPKHKEDTEFFESGASDVDSLISLLNAAHPRSNMLEIGCGIGRMSRHFAERFAKVYAVDFSQEMLRLAREKNVQWKNIEFLKCDGLGSLHPITDNLLDVTVSWHVFQHISDLKVLWKYIRETARVLKRNGTGILHFDTRKGSIPSVILANLPPLFDALLLPRHRFGMRRIRRKSETIRSHINEAGLTIVKELNPDSEKHLFVVVKH